MRVGIDGKVLSRGAAGIGRYAANLLRALVDLDTPETEFVVFTGPQTEDAAVRVLAGRCRVLRSPLKSSLLRALITLPRAMRRHGLDVFHGLDHVGLPWFADRGRCVVTVHDVMPLDHPSWFSAKHRLVVRLALRRVLQRAAAIIVPSECVRQDVLRRGLGRRDRVEVVPEGCDGKFHPRARPVESRRVRERYRLPARYLLFVGTLDPRKNLRRLLAAMARLGREDVGLVVAGAPGRNTTELRAGLERLRLEDRVRLTGFVDDEDLPQLYRGALAFVFPSLYEGFGLPVLEAMACGVPVITSNVSAMPEVAGDAALLVDPTSEEQIVEALRRVLDDQALRQGLIERGTRRAAEFDWTRTARRTLEIYRRVAS